jgi:hypothetical protein
MRGLSGLDLQRLLVARRSAYAHYLRHGVSNKVVVDLGEAKLSPQDQKELDQQEGANEVVD